GYVDDYTTQLFVTINNCIISEIIGLAGVISNIINVIVFYKQGFQDTVNISLFGLSVSDLGSLLTLQWENICFNPLFQQLDLPFDPSEIEHVTAGWPHVCFARITSMITAYITFERCLCVAMPLKVKIILTPKRTSFIIVGIFLVMFASTSPIFTVYWLQEKFNSVRNRTLISIVYAPNREVVERITLATNNVLSYISFFSVSIFTAVLVTNLNRKTKWRQNSAVTDRTSVASTRDNRVVKMVISISVVFIVCFAPNTMMFLGTMISPEFGTAGHLRNLNYILVLFGFSMEAINSSTSILIYLKMSSKYKQAFDEIFLCFKSTKSKYKK
ncbi:unnamed protein product, partial [Lymnaea stagnalis]